MPAFAKSAALVRVIMLRAAFAMLVCGCVGCLYCSSETGGAAHAGTVSRGQGEEEARARRGARAGGVARCVCVLVLSRSGPSGVVGRSGYTRRAMYEPVNAAAPYGVRAGLPESRLKQGGQPRRRRRRRRARAWRSESWVK